MNKSCSAVFKFTPRCLQFFLLKRYSTLIIRDITVLLGITISCDSKQNEIDSQFGTRNGC